MKHTKSVCISCVACLLLLSSCSNSDDILKALKIDYTPAKKQKAADQKTIAELKKQLAAAEKKETALNQQVLALETKLGQQESSLTGQVAELKNEFDQQQAALSDKIEELRNEISEKETIISIQGKVIGLLDDADHTLQKSIKAQIKDTGY